jgi:hypothetical protein
VEEEYTTNLEEEENEYTNELEENVKNCCYNKVNLPDKKKEPPLIDHHVVRTFTLFCEKLGKNHLPPNYIVFHNFLYWMALNLGYRSSTIRQYRHILQDYFKESGFDLIDKVKRNLQKVVLQIKITHKIKNQNIGKPPCMYQDLKNLLVCILFTCLFTYL